MMGVGCSEVKWRQENQLEGNYSRAGKEGDGLYVLHPSLMN
jgi:hypothetical protein